MECHQVKHFSGDLEESTGRRLYSVDGAVTQSVSQEMDDRVVHHVKLTTNLLGWATNTNEAKQELGYKPCARSGRKLLCIPNGIETSAIIAETRGQSNFS